jgi:hypothetical protein
MVDIPVTEEDIRAQEAREAGEYGTNKIMSASGAVGLLGTLRAWEAELMAQFPWDKFDAVLFAVYAQGEDEERIGLFALEVVQLPEAFWAQGQTPAYTLDALAHAAEERPRWFEQWRVHYGVDPRRPVVGWGFAAEAWVRPSDGGPPTDDVRTVTLVDVDQRLYSVQRRHRGEPEMEAWIQTPRQYGANLAQVAERMPEQYGGPPRVPDALARLAKLTQKEVELRHLLRP